MTTMLLMNPLSLNPKTYASAEGEEDSYEEDSDDETRSEQVNMD